MKKIIYIVIILTLLACTVPNNGGKYKALVIGVDIVDQSKYDTNIVPLSCCVNDAKYMKKLLENNHYEVKLLIGSGSEQTATKANVINHIDKISTELKKGDNFFIYYSGHGTQMYDDNYDEKDKYDEALCLYDGALVDDKLFASLKKFKGVNVVFVSDSCHSASIFKADNKNKLCDISDEKKAQYKKQIEMEEANGIERPLKNKELESLQNFIMIGSCGDEQLSESGSELSLFTKTFLGIHKQYSNSNYSLIFEKVKQAVDNTSMGEQIPEITLQKAKQLAKKRFFTNTQ